MDKIQLNTDVSELRWLEDEQLWEATITHMAPGSGDMGERDRQAHVVKHGKGSVYLKQEKVRAKIAISAIGGLVEPKAWPDHIPGSEQFNGDLFHTARWRDGVELKGKDVILVGTGCSSCQVAQSLLENHDVKSITQLMRSPPWLDAKVPEPNHSVRYPTDTMDALVKYPLLGPLFRYTACFGAEWQWFNLFLEKEKNIKTRQQYQERLLHRMKKLAPKEYHEILTPDYPVGCKRRVFDPNPGWYQCMNDPRFRLTTQKLISVEPDGITLSGNQSYPSNIQREPKENEVIPADVILLANGYDIRDWLHPLRVFGRGGKSIHDVWKERGGPQAYMCCAMDGYPNFFILNGPNIYSKEDSPASSFNANLPLAGHHSVFLASENMVMYTIKMIRGVLNGEVDTVEVKKTAEIEWTKETQRKIKQTVFASSACTSWYKVEDGWNSTTYPRSQTDFMLRCYFPKWRHWDIKLSKRGKDKQNMRRVLGYSIAVASIVGAFWASRHGTTLYQIMKTLLIDRLDQVLQLSMMLLMKAQKKLK